MLIIIIKQNKVPVHDYYDNTLKMGEIKLRYTSTHFQRAGFHIHRD